MRCLERITTGKGRKAFLSTNKSRSINMAGLRDDILVKDVLVNIKNAILLKEYLDYPKGPCMLVLQKDIEGKPIHVVWGIPKDANSPAV